MATAAELRLVITARDQARRTIRQNAQELRGLQMVLRSVSISAEQVAQGVDRLGNRLTVTAGVLGALLAAAGGSAIRAAMDVVESENLFRVSMGAMEDEARAFSETLRAQFGLNAFAIRRQVATFNTMLRSMGIGEQAAFAMARGLTMLTHDLASFFNLSPEEAFEKLQAGITGEVEPLKRLGIVINETAVRNYALRQGLIAANEEMSEAQKVVARYGLILEQTALAQGDLARTIESPANQLRIAQQRFEELRIEIGQKLLPVAATALMWITNEGLPRMQAAVEKAAEVWGDLSEEARRRLIAVGLLFLAGGPLLKGISIGIQAIALMARAFNLLPVAARAAVLKAILIIGLVGLAIEALTKQTDSWLAEAGSGFVRLGNLLHGTGVPLFERMSKGFVAVGEAMVGMSGQVNRAWHDALGSIQRQAEAALGSVDDVVLPRLDDLLRELETLGKRGLAEFDRLIGFDDAGKRAEEAVEQAKRKSKELAETLKPPADIRQLWDQAARGIEDGAKAAKDRISELQDALSEARRRLEELSRPTLVGMTAMDEAIFQVEQEIARRRLRRIGRHFGITVPEPLTPEAREFVARLPRGTRQLERFREALELRRQLEFEPQLRLVEQAARGPVREVTLQEALEQIAKTKIEIVTLEQHFKLLQEATREQQNAASAQVQAANALERASDALATQLNRAGVLASQPAGTAMPMIVFQPGAIQVAARVPVSEEEIVSALTRTVTQLFTSAVVSAGNPVPKTLPGAF